MTCLAASPPRSSPPRCLAASRLAASPPRCLAASRLAPRASRLADFFDFFSRLQITQIDGMTGEAFFYPLPRRLAASPLAASPPRRLAFQLHWQSSYLAKLHPILILNII